MHSFSFAGRLGRDAEVRHLQDGTPICKFTVASDVGFGEKKKTLWLDCAMFRERGEKLARFLTKGTQVFVVGEISVRAWTKDGEARAAIDVRVNDVELLGGGQKGETSHDPAMQGPTGGGDINDDIPF